MSTYMRNRLLPLLDRFGEREESLLLCEFDPGPCASRGGAPGVIARVTEVVIDESGGILRSEPGRRLVAEVDLDSELVDVAPRATERERDPSLLVWLEDLLERSDTADQLLGQRLLARARAGSSLQPALEQTGWAPGDLAPWSFLFPLEAGGVCWVDDRAYLVEESYCITPGCPCQEIYMEVARVTRRGPEYIGLCEVDLAGGAIRLDHGDAAAIELVEELTARPDAAEVHKARWGQAHATGAAVLAPRRRRGGRRGRRDPGAVLRASAQIAAALADFMSSSLGSLDWDRAWLLEFFGDRTAPDPDPAHPATQCFMGWLFYRRILDDGRTLAERYLEEANPRGLPGAYMDAALGTPYSVYRVLSASRDTVRVEDVLTPGVSVAVRDPEGARALEPGRWILAMVVQLQEGAVFEGAWAAPLPPSRQDELLMMLERDALHQMTTFEHLARSRAIIMAFGEAGGWIEAADDDEEWRDDDEEWRGDDEEDPDNPRTINELIDAVRSWGTRAPPPGIKVRLRRSCKRLGPGAIEALTALLDDAGQAPLLALTLLTELGAPEAARPMLRLLMQTPLEAPIRDPLILALVRLWPAAALEPIFEALGEQGRDGAHRESLLTVLSMLDSDDARILDTLVDHLDRDPGFAAGCLARHGDRRALEPLGVAIDAFVAATLPEHPYVDRALEQLCDAFEELGGELDGALRRKRRRSEATRDRLIALEEASDASTPAAPRQKLRRPGRNKPCWCGSGKKYKKCHLRQDEKEDRS